jgi:hypothetical protein
MNLKGESASSTRNLSSCSVVLSFIHGADAIAEASVSVSAVCSSLPKIRSPWRKSSAFACCLPVWV